MPFRQWRLPGNFEDSLRKTLFPKLNPEAPTAFADRLVKNLYCLLQSKGDYEIGKTILETFENHLYQEMELAQLTRSPSDGCSVVGRERKPRFFVEQFIPLS